jgi:molecular chaperone GrpE (heat shock protein)
VSQHDRSRRRSSNKRNTAPKPFQPNVPEAEKTLVDNLRVCKRDLETVAFQLRPVSPLENIDEKAIREFLEKLRNVLQRMERVPDNTKFLKNNKDGTVSNIVEAIDWLIVSLDLESKVEEKTDKNTLKQSVESLRETYKSLVKALKNFAVDKS